MKSLSRPFRNLNNQLIFCTFGLFYITNVNYWITSIPMRRSTVYPIYLIINILFFVLLTKTKYYKNNIGNATYLILVVLLFLGISCTIRGLFSTIDKDTIRFLLSSVTGSPITWLMPVILLPATTNQFWFFFLAHLRKIVIWGMMYVLLIMVTSLSSSNYPDYEMYNSADFLFLSPLLIVCSIYISHRIGIIIGCIGTLTLLVHMFFTGERFSIAFTGTTCILFILNVLTENKKIKEKIFTITIVFITITVTYICLQNTALFNKYIYTNFVQGDMYVDSRGNLGKESTSNMTTFEYFFGKGTSGRYIATSSRSRRIADWDRINIEIGYKQIWLKGGLVMLICFLCLAIRAVFLGLFRTNNKLTKYLSYIIISRLIIMSTAMIPRVGFEYFMYWIIVGGCLSSQLRGLDNNTLNKVCSTKHLGLKW